MKENVIMNVKNVREAYEAPKCEVIEMQNEGVLCASGQTGGSAIDGFWSGDDYEGGWN